MARLTAEAIFGSGGRNSIRDQLQDAVDAKADLERAKRAGVDTTEDMARLEEATEQLRKIAREYYPDLTIPQSPTA